MLFHNRMCTLDNLDQVYYAGSSQHQNFAVTSFLLPIDILWVQFRYPPRKPTNHHGLVVFFVSKKRRLSGSDRLFLWLRRSIKFFIKKLLYFGINPNLPSDVIPDGGFALLSCFVIFVSSRDYHIGISRTC